MEKRFIAAWIFLMAVWLPTFGLNPPDPCYTNGCWSGYAEALYLRPLGAPFDYDRLNGRPQREITLNPDPHWGWRAGGWYHTCSWFMGGSYQMIKGNDSRDNRPEAIGLIFTHYQAVDLRVGIYQKPSCLGNFYGFVQARWVNAHQSKRALRNNQDDRVLYDLGGAGLGLGAGAMIRFPWGFSLSGEASMVGIVGPQRTKILQEGNFQALYSPDVRTALLRTCLECS